VSIADPGVPVEGGRKGALLSLEAAPQGALVAIDPRSREILALVGGYDGVRAGLDRATRARRQPGSTFKAFVYSYALHDRSLTAASLIETDPAKIEGYKPKNADPTVHDPLRLREVLAKSVNVSAVWTQSRVGAENVVAWAKALGIESEMKPTPSLALGAYETTPRELANAYASLASGGVADEPRLILEILAPSGRQVPLPATPAPRRVMTPAEAYVTTSVLREVIETGTGKAARSLKRPAAGKTGTSNGGKDAWFAGYTTDVACAVWVGFDDGAPLGSGESGAKAALPAWIDFMKAAHQGKPAADFPPAPGVVRVKIDPKTGLRAREDQEGAIEEVFLEGTEPTEVAPEPEIEEPAGEGEARGDEGNGDDAAGDDAAGAPAKKDGKDAKPPPVAKVNGTEEEAVVDLPPF
jgi:penicillin-binding protein 1A